MGWGSRKTNIEGGLPKKGAPWTFCKFKGEDLARKRVVIFLRGFDTSMHTLPVYPAYSCLRDRGERSVLCLYGCVMYQK